MAKQTNEQGINTGIAWCDYTLNLWWGCTEVHEGCDNCYARTLAHRWGFEVWGAKGVRRLVKSWQKTLNKYQREAASASEVRTVFVGSMMDIFEKPMPLVNDEGTPAIDYADGSPICTDWPRDELFAGITAGQYPNLLFLLLTKRPSNINKYIPAAWKANGAPENVMFGTSPVNQETADRLIPQLSNVWGRRFLSMEPLLGPVDLSYPKSIWPDGPEMCCDGRECGCMGLPSEPPLIHGVEWIIVGGESGYHARQMEPRWALDIKAACDEAGIKFHFKQGSQANWPDYKNQSSYPVELQVRALATDSTKVTTT